MREAIFAPTMMAMLWIVASIMNNQQFVDSLFKQSRPSMLALASAESVGASGTPIVVVNFAILIAMLIGGIIISKSFTSSAGGAVLGMAEKWSRKAVVGMTLGLAGRVGRQTLGRGFNAAANSGAMERLVGRRPFLGGLAMKGARGIASSSFDARGAGLGGVGETSGKGGYSKWVDDKKKKEIEFAKSLKTNVYADENTKKFVGGHKENISREKNNIARLQREVFETKKRGGDSSMLEANLAKAIRSRDESAKTIKEVDQDRALSTTATREYGRNIAGTIWDKLVSKAQTKARDEIEKGYDKRDTEWAGEHRMGEINREIEEINRQMGEDIKNMVSTNNVIAKYEENTSRHQEQIDKNLEIIRKAEENRQRNIHDPGAIRAADEARAQNQTLNQKIDNFKKDVEGIKTNKTSAEQAVRGEAELRINELNSEKADIKKKKDEAAKLKRQAEAYKNVFDEDKGGAKKSEPKSTPPPPPSDDNH